MTDRPMLTFESKGDPLQNFEMDIKLGELLKVTEDTLFIAREFAKHFDKRNWDQIAKDKSELRRLVITHGYDPDETTQAGYIKSAEIVLSFHKGNK